MHHIYTGSKGDPLCPLGFHPQVRWPTRCKRCFRDYKEHGGKGKDQGLAGKDDMTRSTPSLSTWSSSSRARDDRKGSLSSLAGSTKDTAYVNGTDLNSSSNKSLSSSSTWTSTPDLGNLNEEMTTTVSVTLPRRRPKPPETASNNPTEFTVRRRAHTTDLSQVNIQNGSSLNGKQKTTLESDNKQKEKIQTSGGSIKPRLKKSVVDIKKGNAKVKTKKQEESDALEEGPINPDVEFILRVKSSKPDLSKKSSGLVRQTSSVLIPPHTSSSSSSSGPEDSLDEDDCASTTNTETTEMTLVGKNDSELLEEVESLRNELEVMKAKYEKVEREKSDILLRRLASLDTTPTKTAASEVLKLQQKVNELSTQSEDLQDDNKSLSLRVKELEKELDEQKKSNKSTKLADELQAKLAAAEALCEELMDENEDMKKELRELEDEIEEMQDNFREDQADEYSSLKKELEQTTKNCRILSFKLRKSERKAEQLETEKLEVELKYKEMSDQKGVNSLEKIKKLEADLKIANEVAKRLTKELEDSTKRLTTIESKSSDSSKNQKMYPENTLKPEKVSRASLTRGGSQEDPQQLLRDLQDSMEREADLREQLKFAEEEAANLRKKAARVEEDNDSLALQLKKMATKAKTSRRSSPSTTLRTPKPVMEKDEGISDEEDPAELRLMLELNEQESAVLRKKVEDLEADAEKHKKKIKELEDKVSSATATGKKFGGMGSTGGNTSLLDKQKLKVIEEEVTELRKKVSEKEREIERLKNEIQVSPKQTSRGQLVKSQSLDSPADQKSLDLKRQLQVVEQEATVLRTKITGLEAENEKLSAEKKKLELLRGTKKAAGATEQEKITGLETKVANYEKQIKELKAKVESMPSDKTSSLAVKSSEIDKLKSDLKTKTDEVDKLTKENKSIMQTLRKLRDDAAVDAIEFYKSRKPKKPTDLTTKLQLKKMVEDLENEIGDILVILQRAGSSKVASGSGSTQEIEENKKKIMELEEAIKKEVTQKEIEKKKLEDNIKKQQQEKEAWKNEKRALETEVDNLKADKKTITLTQEEVTILGKKLEASKKQLEEEKANTKKLTERCENYEKSEREKGLIEKNLLSRTAEMKDLEKKLTETEEKLKKSEKNLSVSRGKVAKLEKNVEELEKTKDGKDKKCQSLEDELSLLKTTNLSLNGKITEMLGELRMSKDAVKDLEDSIRKERERVTDEYLKAGSVEKKEITALRDDLSKKSKQMEELTEKLDKSEKARKAAEESQKKLEVDMLRETKALENKASELESQLSSEKKKAEKAKMATEKEQKTKDDEILELKAKVVALEKTAGLSSKELANVKDEWRIKCQRLEKELTTEKKRYDELTSKYELLEEEHVVTKAQLVMEKEQAQNQLGINKKEITTLEVEVKSLQDTLSSKQESWTREKKEIQERAKGNVDKATKTLEAKWEMEKTKLKAINDEQKSMMDQLKQRNESMVEQMDHMRKENEELRKKLDDFDKVSKIQRQISSDTQHLEAQLREAREKLSSEEKNHKSEITALKLRYESRVNLISGELQTSQNHLSRFKRERDSFKHMLEEAKTQMADLKIKGSVQDISDELKDSKSTMAALEQQISCLEDELSESRLECSKLRTELVSERSVRDVKLSELQSKVNELEEEKILSSGRTKVSGLRTKMELAWQKEREDQQRLLQETSALARDLRQTLYEVERERDKIKLESKRIQEQIKRTSEEEMEENRKKINELQCDLLELRDAHAKLRTTNEKLRREKEKWERENRTAQKTRIRSEEDDRKLELLLDNIDLLLKTNFEKKSSGRFADASPKKRAGSKSRESSPLTTSQDELQVIMQRLSETAEGLRIKMQSGDRTVMDDRTKRASSVGYRSIRATSTESDTSEVPRRPVPLSRKSTLNRKSISLSETAGPGAQDQAIWREADNGGSLTSLDEPTSSRLKHSGYRENSMDSRLSGGSTQSDMVPGDRKKKKGLFGKLKKLTKSRSIDDPTSSQEDVLRGGGSDSDMSAGGDVRGSKRDLKGKLAEIFKKESSKRPLRSKICHVSVENIPRKVQKEEIKLLLLVPHQLLPR
ncbi:hypothetical protein RUM43_014021 [Polyplax serrata]|uniref:Uncharacterized protein n=1 Tax=Polyplax serrata TaxID=468196 RepID=A0AAN8S2Q5_POLSC